MRSLIDFTLSPPTSTELRSHRSSGTPSYVVLDKAWAERLGVHRSSGVYRISRRELALRLQQLNQPQAPAPVWEIDPAHTHVGFVARYLMLSNVRGGFRDFSGTLRLADDPEESFVEITIDAASIDTGIPARDEHLRSEDFLDVRRHPELKFRSTRLERLDGANFELTGDLTIKGITRPVTLEVRYLGAAPDTSRGLRARFEAQAQIDREEFGLTWNRALESGGFLIDRHVTLQIQAQAAPRSGDKAA